MKELYWWYVCRLELYFIATKVCDQSSKTYSSTSQDLVRDMWHVADKFQWILAQIAQQLALKLALIHRDAVTVNIHPYKGKKCAKEDLKIDLICCEWG